MNLSEIKAFIVFLFSKKKIIFFTCSSLFIFTLLFNLLIPQNYRGEITIHKFNDIAIEEYANQNNKFFGFLYNFNSKYNVTYNSKNRLINYNQLENRYLYNEDYFLNFIRNNIDSELIKEGIFYSKIHENSSENEIDQKVLEYIKKIKINSSKEFLTGFIRSEKNYIYLTFKYSDSEKIKIFLDYLISESIKDLKKEYFDNRKLELIKIIQDNLEKQQITIQENLEKKQIKVQENLEKQRNTNVLNVVDAGFSNLHINQKITREIYNLEIKECVSEIQNLIKRISFIDKNANYDVTVKIYNFKIDLNNAKKFLQDLLKTAKKLIIAIFWLSHTLMIFQVSNT